jgi:hypothetical protein
LDFGLTNFFSFPSSANTLGVGTSALALLQYAASSAACATCLPSSTLGVNATHAGQHRPLRFVPFLPGVVIDANIGSKYANVFPDPVSASNTADFPRTSSGIANR